MKRADFGNESLIRAAQIKARSASGRVPPQPKLKKRGANKPPQHPQALIDFMMEGWAPRDGRLPAPLPHAGAFARRRRALSRAFPGDYIVIPTGHEKTRANDTTYRFRPGSDFFYLTGNLEPDCVLVLEPKGTGGHRDILFVEPNPGRADKTFFTDHSKGELWVGPRLGVTESRARFGVHECRGLPDLKDYLQVIRAPLNKVVRVLRGFSHAVDQAVPVAKYNKAGLLARKEAVTRESLAPGAPDHDLAEMISEQRLYKDALEIEEMANVVNATKRAFEDVIVALVDARTEREVEGTFNKRARVEGNDVGYGTIAASGANACILHWTRNDARLDKRDLLLLDAGVEGNQLYTADITRTLPISGTFGKAQREIYDLVCEAQAAALAEVRPGKDFMDPNRAAQRVLAEGLVRLGILKVDVETALDPDQQLQKRYTLHNVSHMLGLDVHDCAKARLEVYRYGKLRPGMVLTVEPGLYFQPDDLTVPKRYRGIGVRIEDDVLVTEDGMRNLSESIPRESAAVEAWMRQIWARKVKR